MPVEHIKATKDQLARRTQLKPYCKAHGIPFIAPPLDVDSEAETKLRIKDQVGALALCYIELKSEGLSPERLAEIDNSYGITPKLTLIERAYVATAHPTDQQRRNANWSYENLHVLLCALGHVDALTYPDVMCGVAHNAAIIHNLSAAQLHKRAKLRTKREILDPTNF